MSGGKLIARVVLADKGRVEFGGGYTQFGYGRTQIGYVCAQPVSITNFHKQTCEFGGPFLWFGQRSLGQLHALEMRRPKHIAGLAGDGGLGVIELIVACIGLWGVKLPVGAPPRRRRPNLHVVSAGSCRARFREKCYANLSWDEGQLSRDKGASASGSRTTQMLQHTARQGNQFVRHDL